jgi:hypothetical protein
MKKDVVPQSRELGDVIPNRAPAARDEKPEAKPLAHFVAGGYVSKLEIFQVETLEYRTWAN